MSSGRIHIASQLAAPVRAVWAEVSTMRGVNRELAPLVKMTHPAAADSLSQAEVPLGQVAFHSWLLLFRVLPFDRHALRLLEVVPDAGFREDSSSWLQRHWRHERWLEPLGSDGTLLTDRVEFEPRLAPLLPLVERLVARIFAHRHRQLHRAFGGALVAPPPAARPTAPRAP
jgi:ligand-binding SRPBCC domain-containing protein